MSLSDVILGGAAIAGAGFSARYHWWRWPSKGIPVLMYHKIGVPPAGSQLGKLWVSPEMLRKQMDYLKSNGYQPITFREIYAFWDKGTPLPSKPVVITFDDGYENNHSAAFPILKEFGFPATIFIVVYTVEGDNRWHDPKSETRIAMLSWKQILELRDGGWEIGSHTLNHPRLPTLTPEKRKEEMEKSREILKQKLGYLPDTFAYPYGAGEDDPAIRDQAKAAGYRIAVGVHAGKWNIDEFKSSPFNLPRAFVRGDESLFDFHIQMTRGRSRF